MQNNQLELFNEQDFYHSVSNGGFFSLCHKSQSGVLLQRSYRLELMPDVIRAVDSRRDTYLSQAEFLRPNRRVVNLKQLSLAFLDLDVYRSEYQYHTPDQVCGLLLEFCDSNQIPIPSVLMSSGRGLYAKWFLSTPIPPQALPRWSSLQKHLAATLAPFGADKGALDASRILRLQGTVNTKNDEICRVLWPLHAEPKKYDFEQLCREVLPIPRDQIRESKKTQLYKISGGSQKGLSKFSPLRLWWDRLGDVRTLAQMRGGVKEGQRDLFLFLSSTALSWVVPPSQLNREVEVLAREFCPGMSRTEAWAATGSVRKRAEAAAKGEKIEFNGQLVDSRYRISNEWIINALKITQDEISHLKTIIGKDEAKKRHRERNMAKRRESGSVDRKSYESMAQERRLRVENLLNRGMQRKQIACELNISLDAAKSLIRQVRSGGVKSVRMYMGGTPPVPFGSADGL